MITREWRTKNFLKALELCDRIGQVSEAEGHHPDLHITGRLWAHGWAPASPRSQAGIFWWDPRSAGNRVRRDEADKQNDALLSAAWAAQVPAIIWLDVWASLLGALSKQFGGAAFTYLPH